jgi:murein DD-endopeptidase MepM/ murein hydrolase activator NlpD
VSYAVPRHRKPARSAVADAGAGPRHRKQPEAAHRARRRPGRLAAITGTLLIVGAAAAAVVIYLPGRAGDPAAGQARAGSDQVKDSLGRTVANGVGLAISALPRAEVTSRAKAATGSRAIKPAGRTAPAAVTTHHRPQQKPAAATVYLNPLRAVTGLIPERIDMGADFGGSGPVYALGNAVITNATANSSGWPGGGWITYQLTDGPAKGLVVYLAEDVTPAVQVGQNVTSATVIAKMFNGGAGIETGWATSDSSTAESQMPEAGGISGQGPFPSAVGINFEDLLVALGVPRSPFNGSATPFGVLPSGYPTNWSALITKS